MPAPANADELLDLIQRSGVIDAARLREYVKKLSEASGIPADPQKFAGVLVRDGILTYFQAEQLLQGKYKRFTIGKYKVLERLGAGGMAQVFLCEHKLMRRRVAIKVLPTAKADDPSSLERFYREARAVAAVDHPNIVRAYDIDQDEHLHFLVMEYVDGTNLQDLVKKFGPLDVTRACHYIYGSAVGLQHAHEMGLVHRDVKPGNILLDRTGVVKILDMGLARFFHDEDDALTRKYDENILGTADYLAPEQAEDSHTVDIRADIYSLGATFYYLLTGSPPFPEGSVAQKLIRHQKYDPRPVKSLRPEVPDAVVAVLNRMMTKKPADRFQTPAEVMTALAQWVTTPIPPPSDKEMPQVSAAAAAVRGPTSMHASQTAIARSGGSGSGTPLLPPQPQPVPAPPTQVASAQPMPLPLPDDPADAPPAPTAAASSAPAAVWESLGDDADTQTVGRGDTDRPQTPERTRRRGTPEPTGGRKRLLLAVLALALVGGAAAGVYYGFIKKAEPEPAPDLSAKNQLVVSAGGGEGTFPTLEAALDLAEPGSVVVIRDAKLSVKYTPLNSRRHKNVTIQGESAGSPPVLEFTGSDGAVIAAADTEGFKLKNLVIDGAGNADIGVDVRGTCPGVTIENVTVRNLHAGGATGRKSKPIAFRLYEARGADGNPVTLDRVRAQLADAAQTGVFMTSEQGEVRRVLVRDSRFEGARRTATGVRVEGPAGNVEVVGNRFFDLDAAVVLAGPTGSKPLSCTVTGNTVVNVKAGVHLDVKQPTRFDAVSVSRNAFFGTEAVGRVAGAKAPVGGVKADKNVQSNSSPGNAGWTIGASGLPPPKTDPNDDSTFLKSADGKVGAP